MLETLLASKLSVVGQLAHNLGLPVTRYTLSPIQWQRPIWLIMMLPILYLTVLYQLYRVLHLSTTDAKRTRTGWCMITFIIGFPFLWGSQSSGSKVVDFGLSVIAFVLSLRLYRITFLRPATETAHWSLLEYFGRLFTFPTEYEVESNSTTRYQGRSARVENAADLGMASFKVAVSLVFIRFIPPPEAFLDMSWLQQRVYYAVLGAILLVCLEGFVGGFFGAYGFLCNRHMRHMFNHPLISAGFRDLWGHRWNLPVHDILKNVIFNGITFPISQWCHAPSNGSKQSKSKVRHRGFRENALAAFLTFMVSGAFHEIMSYMAFGDFRWSNIKYFSWNALGCTIEVLLEHSLFPAYKTIKRKWWFRLVFIMFWAIGSESYTDGYLNFGFFEEAKVWIGIFAPMFAVREVIWLPVIGKPVRGNW